MNLSYSMNEVYYYPSRFPGQMINGQIIDQSFLAETPWNGRDSVIGRPRETGQAFHDPKKKNGLALSEQMSTGHGVAFVIFEKDGQFQLSRNFQPSEVPAFVPLRINVVAFWSLSMKSVIYKSGEESLPYSNLNCLFIFLAAHN